MDWIDLSAFLVGYLGFVVVLTGYAAVSKPTPGKIGLLALATLAWIAHALIVAKIEPAGLSRVILSRVSERDPSVIVALGLGGAAALSWLTAGWLAVEWLGHPAEATRRRMGWLHAFVLVASLAGVTLGSEVLLYSKALRPGGSERGRGLRAGVTVTRIATLPQVPLRVAPGAEGVAFVSFDYYLPNGKLGGGIVRLTPSADGAHSQRIVALSALLFRPYGLAAHEGDLYVSRSGLHAEATEGEIRFESTGVVTRLRDVDGNGEFEHFHDVLRGLPGLRDPDTMHQNAGLGFAPDGSLFVATSSADNRSIDDHEWAGVVLRLPPGGEPPEVFARGLRNPFGLAVGPGGRVFVTDNDVEENPGDEVNHVVRGAHLGHPFVIGSSRGEDEGFTAPIFVDEEGGNLTGIALTKSPNLPDEYRGSLFVADYTRDRILQLRLDGEGESTRVAEARAVAYIVGPIDVAETPEGDLLVVSRNEKAIYRVRLR